MDLYQFIDKWIGKKADWDGAYGGQCVDLFRFYNHEVLEIDQPKGVVGAADFWTNYESDSVLGKNFDKIPNTPNFTPQSGDVMLWNKNAGGGFGHVAICTGENTGTQYFKSFDQNWSRVSYCEIVNHNYKNVLGVLRPKAKKNENMTNYDEVIENQNKLITKLNKDVFNARKDRGLMYVELRVSQDIYDDPGVEAGLSAIHKLQEDQKRLADTERVCQKQLEGINNARADFFKHVQKKWAYPIKDYGDVISLIGLKDSDIHILTGFDYRKTTDANIFSEAYKRLKAKIKKLFYGGKNGSENKEVVQK